MGWLILGAVVLLLCCLPLGVSATYDEQGPAAWLLLWPVKLLLYPRKKRDKHSGSGKRNKASEPKFEKKKSTAKGGSYVDFLPIVRDVLELLVDFRNKIRVKRLEMKLVLADSDPCDLALNYGRAWAALGNLMPQLERLFVIKKRDLEVECDFTANKTLIFFRIDITITLGRLLFIALFHGSRILKKYTSILNQRKGGVKV